MPIPSVPSPLLNIIAAKTYNAAWFSGSSNEQKIQNMITSALADGATVTSPIYGYIPANMYPYNASLVTFSTAVPLIREFGNPSVFDIKAYGAYDDNATDSTEAFQACILAAGAVGSGNGRGQRFWMPTGQYVLSNQITVPLGVIVDGDGSRSVNIRHTANGICFYAHESADSTARRSFRGFRIEGNTGASARGIDFGDFSNSVLEDIVVENYTAGIGIRCGNDFTNTRTDNTSWDRVFVKNCAKNIAFEKTAGTGNFGGIKMNNVYTEMFAAAQVGLDIAASCVLFGPTLDVYGNNSSGAASAIFVRLGNNALIDRALVNLHLEATGNGGVGISLGSNAYITCAGSMSFEATCTHVFGTDSLLNFDGRTEFVTPTLAALSAGNNNNYQPGIARVLRLTADGAGSTITGVAIGQTIYGDCKELLLVNISANALTIAHDSGSSTAANRILSPTGANIVLSQNDSVRLWYDGTTQRWRVVATNV